VYQVDGRNFTKVSISFGTFFFDAGGTLRTGELPPRWTAKDSASRSSRSRLAMLLGQSRVKIVTRERVAKQACCRHVCGFRPRVDNGRMFQGGYARPLAEIRRKPRFVENSSGAAGDIRFLWPINGAAPESTANSTFRGKTGAIGPGGRRPFSFLARHCRRG